MIIKKAARGNVYIFSSIYIYMYDNIPKVIDARVLTLAWNSMNPISIIEDGFLHFIGISDSSEL